MKTALKKKSKSEANVKSSGSIIGDILDAVGKDDGAQLLGANSYKIKLKGVISTQCVTLDAAIGRGGIPKGRLTIIHGPESVGKSTLCGHLVSETQQNGGIAIYYDNEYKVDPDYFAKIGVDIDKLIICQPPYLERFYISVDRVIDRVVEIRKEKGIKIPVLVVLDSMNSAIAKMEYEGEYGDQHYSPQARVHSASLPKIMPKISKEDIALVYISQIRTNIGQSYGDSDTISGGKAPKFYASVIMKMSRSTALNSDGEKVGNVVDVICSKNQIAVPFRRASFDIIYGRGIARDASLFDQAVKDGIIEKSGSWYTWREEKIGQGRDACLAEMIENDWLDELRNDVYERHEWNLDGSCVTKGE